MTNFSLRTTHFPPPGYPKQRVRSTGKHRDHDPNYPQLLAESKKKTPFFNISNRLANLYWNFEHHLPNLAGIERYRKSQFRETTVTLLQYLTRRTDLISNRIGLFYNNRLYPLTDSKICKDVGCDQRTLQRSLCALRRAGYLETAPILTSLPNGTIRTTYTHRRITQLFYEHVNMLKQFLDCRAWAREQQHKRKIGSSLTKALNKRNRKNPQRANTTENKQLPQGLQKAKEIIKRILQEEKENKTNLNKKRPTSEAPSLYNRSSSDPP